MEDIIKTISLPLPLRMGRVNCYLVKIREGYSLIDTGGSNNRQELIRALEAEGVKPGTLRLILITHGDFDHIGNAAHLRNVYGAPIGMHPAEVGMAERGDMFASRRKPNVLLRLLAPLFFGLGKEQRFSPDILLAEGQSLAEYGLEGRVVSIPGHSGGSIGVLLASGEFFCGDLLENNGKPGLNSLMDDLAAGKASLEKMRRMGITQVYPGHGRAFGLDEIR